VIGTLRTGQMVAKGYAVVLLDVLDQEIYVDYGRRATTIESRYGGKPLVASDVNEVVEGEWPSERVVILEFPSIEQARAWYADPDYQELIAMRHQATVSSIAFVGGFLEE